MELGEEQSKAEERNPPRLHLQVCNVGSVDPEPAFFERAGYIDDGVDVQADVGILTYSFYFLHFLASVEVGSYEVVASYSIHFMGTM